MKKRFYYFRNKKGRRVVTVCILQDGGGYSHRGIAICSLKDNHCKSYGRNLAFRRAITACTQLKSSGMVNLDIDGPEMAALDTVKRTMTAFWFPYKSAFLVKPTHFELKLLHG